MALVKTVEMRVLADAGDAQAKLDELDAKAKELGSEDVKMRFRVDDGDAKTQFDDLKARADELGLKDVTIKVKVDGKGRAIADLQAVRAEADKAGGGSGGPNKIQSLLGKLFGVGGSGADAGGAGGAGSIPLEGLSGGMLAGIAAAVPLLEAALVEVTGLVSGFAAAGAGAGAFALLARPAVKSVETAYAALNAAQQKYHAAQAKEAADPTKANQTALAGATLNLKLAQEAIHKLPADEQSAISGIRNITTEFGHMSKAFEPQVFKVFAAGLGVIRNLLPAIVPFANTFANSLDKLLQQAGKFTQSKGFEQFLGQFHSLEGPALNSIGEGVGKVATAFGKLLTSMSGKDVAHSINIAFGGIAGTIDIVTGAVRRLMSNWDGMSAAARAVGRAVSSAFSSIGSTAKADADQVTGAFDTMRHGVAAAIDAVISYVEALPGKIKGAFAGAAGWLVSAGAAIIEGLINGIESMVGAAVGAAEHVGSSIVGAITGVLHIRSPSQVMHVIGQQTMQGLVAGMQSQLPALEATARKAAALISARVKTEVAYAKGVAASAVSGLGLTSIDLTQGTVATGMQSYLASIKTFTADIKALSSQHLNKSLLQQLIGAGPVTGDQYAQSILQGGGAGQVNALYKQIQKQSALLGAQAAMSMYGGKVTPASDGKLDVTVDVRLTTQKQDFALEVVKVLKEYKRNGGGRALGIA